MNDPAREIETLREKLTDLEDGLTIAYMAGFAKCKDQLAAMTQERDEYKAGFIGAGQMLSAAQAEIERLKNELKK